MTNKDIKQIKCESEKELEEQTTGLLEMIVNAIENKPFPYVYIAASIRLNEMIKLSGTSEESIERIEKILSTASFFKNNQMPYTSLKVDENAIRNNQMDVIEIADLIAEKLQGYCDNVIILALSLLKNYLIDMEMISKEDIEKLSKLSKEIEENIGFALSLANNLEDK